jgi:hypothetical protein
MLILCLIASSVLTSLGFCSLNKRENNDDVYKFLSKFYGVNGPNSNLASYERQDDKAQSELLLCCYRFIPSFLFMTYR